MRITTTLVVSGLLALCACRGADPYPYMQTEELLQRERIEPDFRIPYGEHEWQVGDLRIPDGPGPYPVLITIHGGCWRQGINLRYLDGFCAAMTAAGVATWNIAYHTMAEDEIGWPGLFRDVGAAVDALREIAPEHDLDLNQVVVSGHHSGGQLALWVAARHRVPTTSEVYCANPLPVHGAVCLDGMADLQAYRGYVAGGCPGDVVGQLLGGTPDEVPERYAAVSPIELLPIGVPQLLLTGTRDTFVSPPAAIEYAKVASRFGDQVESIVLADAGNFESIIPESKAFPIVREQILAMFEF